MVGTATGLIFGEKAGACSFGTVQPNAAKRSDTYFFSFFSKIISELRDPRTVKSIFPSGDHAADRSTPVVKFVICLNSPLGTGWRTMFAAPPRNMEYSTARPSTDQCGKEPPTVAPGTVSIAKIGGPPATGTPTICAR